MLQLISAQHALGPDLRSRDPVFVLTPPVLLTDGTRYTLFRFSNDDREIQAFRWQPGQRRAALHFLREMLQQLCAARRARSAIPAASVLSGAGSGGGGTAGGHGASDSGAGAGGGMRGGAPQPPAQAGADEGSSYSASDASASDSAAGASTCAAAPPDSPPPWAAELAEAEWMARMREARCSAFIQRRLGPPPEMWSSCLEEFRAQLLQ